MTGKHRRKRRSRWLGIPVAIALGAGAVAFLTTPSTSEPSSFSLSTSEQLALPELIPPPVLTHVPPQHVAGASPGAHRTYTVQAGDSMWSIAVSECGSGSDWPALAAISRIPDPSQITPGTIIRVAC